MSLSNIESVLITGANRGIGLELIRQFARLSPSSLKYIFATCRNPENATELKTLSQSNSAIHLLKIDLNDESTIKDASLKVEKTLGKAGLNVLFNNAGIKVGLKLDELNSEDMLKVYKTNVVGPCLMIKAFLPLLKQASTNSKIDGFSCSRAAILNVSSILGSITCTKDTSMYYDYDASKAALNMITKSVAVDLKSDHILSVALHPGWVQTDMGGSNANVKQSDSVEGILKVISELKEDQNGLLIDYKGKTLPCLLTLYGCRKEPALDHRLLANVKLLRDHHLVTSMAGTQDLNDESTIKDASLKVEKTLGKAGLNVLINNAGILFRHTLDEVNSEDMLKVYKTNVVGPCLMIKAFLPLLKQASTNSKIAGFSCSRAAIINISGRRGSITSTKNTSQYYEYAPTKTALNMITKHVAVDLKSDHILSVALHPGWAKTVIGGPNANVELSDSVEGVLKVISCLEEEHTGTFIDYTGKTMPW